MNTNEHQSLGATRQLTIWRLLSHITFDLLFYWNSHGKDTYFFMVLCTIFS